MKIECCDHCGERSERLFNTVAQTDIPEAIMKKSASICCATKINIHYNLRLCKNCMNQSNILLEKVFKKVYFNIAIEKPT